MIYITGVTSKCHIVLMIKELTLVGLVRYEAMFFAWTSGVMTSQHRNYMKYRNVFIPTHCQGVYIEMPIWTFAHG